MLEQAHVTQGTGNAIVAWMFPLHSGQAFGWTGRIIIFITGVMICVFVVTGLMIWSRKRRARQKPRAPAPRLARRGA